MFYVLFYLIFAVLTQFITYKWIKRIDMKERKFLKKWEKEYIEAYKDIWKKSYFEKLAEERKMEIYEKEKKKEKEDLKQYLKEVTIDEQFRQEYEENLNQAIEDLEKQEQI